MLVMRALEVARTMQNLRRVVADFPGSSEPSSAVAWKEPTRRNDHAIQPAKDLARSLLIYLR